MGNAFAVAELGGCVGIYYAAFFSKEFAVVESCCVILYFCQLRLCAAGSADRKPPQTEIGRSQGSGVPEP